MCSATNSTLEGLIDLLHHSGSPKRRYLRRSVIGSRWRSVLNSAKVRPSAICMGDDCPSAHQSCFYCSHHRVQVLQAQQKPDDLVRYRWVISSLCLPSEATHCLLLANLYQVGLTYIFQQPASLLVISSPKCFLPPTLPVCAPSRHSSMQSSHLNQPLEKARLLDSLHTV